MFDHLKKLDVKDATSWVEMPELGPEAEICIRPATEANAPYYNALIRRVGKGRRAVKQLTAADLERHRDDDRALYGKLVLAGWKGVLDVEGQEIPFSRDAASELCEKLPGWLFDRLRNHASQPENFLGEDEEALPDPQEVAGN